MNPGSPLQDNNESLPINVRRPMDVMKTVIPFFSNRGHISFVGDISRINWQSFSFATIDSPNQVTLNIADETIPIIINNILTTIGIKTNILNVIVSDDNQILFAAYDQFCDGCVSILSQDRNALYNLLDSKNLIKKERK